MVADHKRVQVAIVKNGLDVAGLDTRTQVLDHLIRIEHVAANLVAKPNRGLGSTNLVECLGALLELDLVQASLENLHARGLVLNLAALVLAGNHNAAGKMRHAHGGIGGVDALAARAARVIHIHANVVGTDLDIDIIGQHGDDLNAGKRGLATLLVVGGANTHQTVHTGLGAKHAKRVLALDGKGRAVDADDLGCGTIVDGDLPAATLAVLHVHLKEHEGPVLRLQATLSGLDGHDRVAMVELAGEPTRKLEFIDGAGQALRRSGSLLAQGGGIGVVTHLLGKLQRRASIRKLAACVVHGGDVLLGAGDLLHRGASGVGVIPKARSHALGLELGHARALLVQMEIRLDLAEPVRKRVQLGGRYL